MTLMRRSAFFALALAGTLALAGGVQAQGDFSNKPIKLVVPYAPAHAVKHPDTIERYVALGIDSVGSTPEACASLTRSDIERYAKAVKLSGAKLD